MGRMSTQTFENPHAATERVDSPDIIPPKKRMSAGEFDAIPDDPASPPPPAFGFGEDTTPVRTEAQNPLKSFAYGAMQSPFDVSGMAALVMDTLRGPDWSGAAVKAGVEGMKSGDMTQADRMQNPALAANARARETVIGNTVGAPGQSWEPQLTSERGWAGGGRGLPYLPIAGAAGPVPLAIEAALTFGGPHISENVTSQLTPEGEEPGMQEILLGGAAELIPAMATPAAFPQKVEGIAGRVATKLGKLESTDAVTAVNQMRRKRFAANPPKGAQEALDLLNEKAARLHRGMYGQGVDKLVPAPVFTMEDMAEGSSLVKGVMPVDAEGAVDYIDEFATALEESVRRNPDVPLRPSQVGEGEGLTRDNWRRAEEGMVRGPDSGARYSNVLGGQQDKAERTLRARFESRAAKGGPVSVFTDRANETLDIVGAQARADWDALPLSEMDGLKFSQLADEAADIIETSELAEDLVPPVMHRLTKMSEEQLGETANMRTIQNFRSRLGRIEEEGIAMGGERAIKGQKAGDMKRRLDKLVDGLDFGDDFNEKTRQARESWGQWKDLEDLARDSGGDVIRGLQNKNPSKAMGRIIASSEPDAKRALDLIADDPEALAAAQTSVQEYIFGTRKPGSVTGGGDSLAGIRKRLADSPGARVLLGEDVIDDYTKWIDILDPAKKGRVGKVSFETTTGSNSTQVEKIRSVLGTAANAYDNKGQAILEVGDSLLGRMTTQLEDEADRVFLLQTILPDRELTAKMLRLPTEAELPMVVLAVEQALKKKAAREAAAVGRATNVGTRAARKEDLQNLPPR